MQLVGAIGFAQCVALIAALRAGHIQRRSGAPVPLSVAPSKDFDGDDGQWSTFTIAVGQPPLNFRVLVSTAVATTWVVHSNGCTPGDTSCSGSRGGVFYEQGSTTWKTIGDYQLALESGLGYTGTGTFGNETIGLRGTDGSVIASLQQQALGTYSSQDFWVGLFGVNPSITDFYNGGMHDSYMGNLKKQNLIPSLSFGYTAGNMYRSKNSFGSLTLGGFDSSRVQGSSLSIPLPSNNSRRLMVGLKTITTDLGAVKNLLPSGAISVNIDSTIPEIWLPTDACTAFEQAFGLVWEPSESLYRVNATLDAILTRSNPNVTLNLAANLTDGSSIDIILPYAAFRQQATKPRAVDSVQYYPLRRAANSTQYVLGRTFLQEAYLIVDYERSNMSISQAAFPSDSAPVNPTLVAIDSPSSSNQPPSPPGPSTNIAGIAGGVVGGVAVVFACGIFFWFQRRKSKNSSAATSRPRMYSESSSKPGSFVTRITEHFPMKDNSSRNSYMPARAEAENDNGIYEVPAPQAKAYVLPQQSFLQFTYSDESTDLLVRPRFHQQSSSLSELRGEESAAELGEDEVRREDYERTGDPIPPSAALPAQMTPVQQTPVPSSAISPMEEYPFSATITSISQAPSPLQLPTELPSPMTGRVHNPPASSSPTVTTRPGLSRRVSTMEYLPGSEITSGDQSSRSSPRPRENVPGSVPPANPPVRERRRRYEYV